MVRRQRMQGFALLALVAGCAETARPPMAPTADLPVLREAREPTPGPSKSAEPAATPATKPSPLGFCGCSLCTPVVSDDACTKDDDCAPSTPCHAPACVAVAKATPRLPGQKCTLDLRCQTADTNRCGCHEGRCALVPRR